MISKETKITATLTTLMVLFLSSLVFVIPNSDCGRKTVPEESNANSFAVKWDTVPCPNRLMLRTETPGGWLVYTYDALTYVPDSSHAWKIK